MVRGEVDGTKGLCISHNHVSRIKWAAMFTRRQTILTMYVCAGYRSLPLLLETYLACSPDVLLELYMNTQRANDRSEYQYGG